MDNALKCLIVDDEPLARKLLRGMLGAYEDMTVIGECSNGVEALAAFSTLNPDVAFLDISMPGLNGLELVDTAAKHMANMPAIVFVTAYDQYALRAFRTEALDYLLKPFDEERLDVTINRIRERRRGSLPSVDTSALINVLSNLRSVDAAVSRLVVRVGDRALLLPVDQIHWIEADGKYVRIHTAKEQHVMRQSLTHLMTILDPRTFLRVSRSAAVNIAEIREIQPWFRGEYMVILRSKVQVPSTRSYRDGIARMLERGIA